MFILTDYYLSLLEQTQAAPSALAMVGYDFFKFTFIYLNFLLPLFLYRRAVKRHFGLNGCLVVLNAVTHCTLFSENTIRDDRCVCV